VIGSGEASLTAENGRDPPPAIPQHILQSRREQPTRLPVEFYRIDINWLVTQTSMLMVRTGALGADCAVRRRTNMHQIPSLLERPKLYYNVDGVGELGIGFMCLGWSLLGWLQLHTPRTSVWHPMYTFPIYVAVMLSIIHYGSKAIKNRITYRRTGFVDYGLATSIGFQWQSAPAFQPFYRPGYAWPYDATGRHRRSLHWWGCYWLQRMSASPGRYAGNGRCLGSWWVERW